MSQQGKVFRLLMWKNFHLRKYRWFTTLVEIFLPILIVYILCKNSSSFIGSESVMKNDTKEGARNISDFYSTAPQLGLVYTPSSNFTDRIVTRVNDVLRTLPPEAVADEIQLELLLLKKYNESSGKTWMGIVFQNVTDDQSSSTDFVYKIRSWEKWYTDRLFPTEEKQGPTTDDPYFVRGFAALQLTIDLAFLQLKKPDVTYEVNFQPFPYPGYIEENPARAMVPSIVYCVVIITSVILSIPLISSIIEEKESGVKELMKVVGVKEWLIWTSWIISGCIISLVSYTVVTFFLQSDFNGQHSAAIRYVDPIVFWIFIMLYCISNISFCFIFSAIFHNTAVATSVFVLAIFLILYGSMLALRLQSLYLIKLSCLFPVGALVQGFSRITYFEINGMWLSWTSLNTLENNVMGVSLGFVYLMLLFDTCLFLFLTYYITAVNPGKFGSKKSPFFIFEHLLSTFNDNFNQELIHLEDGDDEKFFEKAPRTLPISIRIKELYKKFGTVFAVKNVNLEIYDGEITALLGHNGAGKTTTMAILTGMVKPTAGSIIYKNEIDVLQKMDEFRQDLGVCPQEDRLFPYLTALQHLLFFGMLKNISKKKVKTEAKQYLKVMEMESKENDLAVTLSGGMKRKLCLSIALIGNSKTLILDEPTSGLDVESRRQIWDLLLEMRGNRTIILTTHHMEEADALADRIAIMNQGSIVCYGTPMFLKRSYDTGYQLTISKLQNFDRDKILNIVTTTVPNSKMNDETGGEIVYKLPLTETSKFPNLFRALEKEKKALGIKTMSLSCTTMEQVFLNCCFRNPKKTRHTSLEKPIYLLGLARSVDTFSYFGIPLKWKENYEPYTNALLGWIVTEGMDVLRKLNVNEVGGGSIYNHDADSRKNSTVTDGNVSSRGEYSMGQKRSGLSLMCQQLGALLKKKFLYTVQDKMNLFFRIILPSLILLLLLRSSSSVEDEYVPLTLSLKTYSNSKVMLQADSFEMKFRDRFVDFVKRSASHILVANNADVVEGLLQYGRENIGSYRKELVVAADLSDGRQVMLYNRWASHSLPVAINTYSNVLLQSMTNSSSRNIIAINHPIDPRSDEDVMFDPTLVSVLVFWFFALAFYTVDLVNYFSTFLIMERVDGFKHIQFMSSLSPFVYWLGTLMWDFAFFCAVIILRMALFKVFNDKFDFLSFDKHFAVLFVIIFVYGISGLLFLYVTNYLLRGSKEGSYTLVFIFNVVCSILICLYFFYEKNTFNEDSDHDWKKTLILSIVKFVIRVVPSFGYSLIFMKFLSIWKMNIQCSRLPPPLVQQCEVPYLEMASQANPNGLLTDILYLVLDIFLYVCFLTVIELHYFEKLNRHIVNRIYHSCGTVDSSTLDPDVKQERDVVQSLGSRRIPPNSSNVVLLSEGLRKRFVRRFSPFTAVADLNFAVKSGECFGLLGVNGAGKSTSFKMLTGDLLPTGGDATIHNIKLSRKKTEYLSKAGYCAQTNCFIGELSGREMLTLIASLRGVDRAQIKGFVDKWMSVVGLEHYQNQRCQNYSGGNKRKLCTAMSLIGDPSVVFLDEPTTGVDPVSKHKLYDLMERSKSTGQAVILSSHSMEECENLCNRLTIMSKGQMKCIGTAQHLKQRFAQGFSVLIKILDSPCIESRITTLKQDVTQSFKPEFCVLKDEHKGLLYYQVKDVALLWSQLFEKMERIKNDNDIVEDYTISDTSLEEVFISFARQT